MEFQNARVLFYCLGAGMGHLTRAAAIARKLKRLVSGEISIITNSPFHYLLEVEDINTIYLRNLTEINERIGETIRGIIGTINPELLVVDSYPLGIRGELVPLLEEKTYRRAFLRRHIAEELISHREMAADTGAYYNLVLTVEPLPPLGHSGEIECHPLLIRDSEELLAPETAREILMARSTEKIALAVTTGSKSESAEFFSSVEKIFSQIRPENFVLRFASPHNFSGDDEEHWHSIRYFPLLELYRGADLLIGSCRGHNLFYESSAVSIPTLFIREEGMEHPRELLKSQSICSTAPDDMEKKLRESLEKAQAPSAEQAAFENRAQKAAVYLSNLLFSKDPAKLNDYKDRIEWFML